MACRRILRALKHPLMHASEGDRVVIHALQGLNTVCSHSASAGYPANHPGWTDGGPALSPNGEFYT
eukprot:172269-Amphidinium_carterae.1